MSQRALHTHFPSLTSAVPFADLGDLPTPVQALAALRGRLGPRTPELWVKRDDLSAEAYGGNKIRTLEVLFADALAQRATHIVSTGAFGSNHAAATALHARRVGLEPCALLFPQPDTEAARENLEVTLTHAEVEELPHWSYLPYGLARTHWRDRQQGRRSYVMVPGGATPLGALGYVSAALELAEQVARGELPAPRTVVVAVGSTCTSAGLLLGFALAARRGLGFREVPKLVAVRVTPWPVTSHARIVSLAERTAALMGQHGALETSSRGQARAPSRAELAAHLHVDGGYLGLGYGRVTSGGLDAIARFTLAGGPPLDTGYSGKSGAAFLDLARAGAAGPLLFWATKSSAPLPLAFAPGPSGHGRSAEALASLPRMRAFLARH
jgi:D-cysteine desulfhydrase